jgi:hypothetical protein
MILEHLRLRRRVALLAAGVLVGPERAATLAHVGRCARCRSEHDEIAALVRVLESDPVRSAEPELALSVLVDRVERAVERQPATPRGWKRRWLVVLPAAAAALALAVAVPQLLAWLRAPATPLRASIPAATAPPPALTEETLARLERNLAREHAARYLADAGDVLVTVAASAADCDRADDRLDVGGAPERSRELLEKRRLVLSGGEAVASAQGVLDDVELALREVSALPSCVKRRDVDRLRRAVEDRQLLMRIRLMTRELEG